LSVLFYNVLSDIMEISYHWGILYGVRPAKFMHGLINKFGLQSAENILKNKYLVSFDKIKLVSEVVKSENNIIALSKPESFSLYVSIPFCPTRCSYCSFVSHSIEKTAALVDDYVNLLIKEIKETAVYAKNNNLRLETVYFGGGTPTTLSVSNLEKIFKAVEYSFDLSQIREYTVEAGRPDTVTAEKLAVVKSAQAGRISINPQTFNDSVLKIIGRNHTSRQTLEAFELARKFGFSDINMDFIAGLPADTFSSFESSINKAVELKAESITVHTLALKTGAYMAAENNAFDSSDKILAADMVELSCDALSSSDYKPYYMYRQGKSLGNLENVGWCKDNYDCLYNVFMMDETHTVLAVGSGGVTRLKNSKTGKIERIYNYKYPYEYIGNFPEIINRKKKIQKFYDEW
ncbi:MAG: coproporphyrinogen dehydrogenase HemZ, partial [Clostridiales bacterium]|nr:coproporphyrinogen dehydrogenase HemZ [Clostridiales bacterium]